MARDDNTLAHGQRVRYVHVRDSFSRSFTVDKPLNTTHETRKERHHHSEESHCLPTDSRAETACSPDPRPGPSHDKPRGRWFIASGAPTHSPAFRFRAWIPPELETCGFETTRNSFLVIVKRQCDDLCIMPLAACGHEFDRTIRPIICLVEADIRDSRVQIG